MVSVCDYKLKVARSFNRAACSYDSVAKLQAEVNLELLASARKYINTARRLVDVGVGTGKLVHQLEQTFPRGQYYYLDLAISMLEKTQQRFTENKSHCICADFDMLPFASNQIDFIFSSMVLQWSLDLSKTLEEMLRVLNYGGVMAIALPSSGTLFELDYCYEAVGEKSPVNSFYSFSELGELLSQLPITVLQLVEKKYSNYYDSLHALFYFLKGTGANYNPGMLPGLQTPKKLRKLTEYYRLNFSTEYGMRSSFNVTYIILKSNLR